METPDISDYKVTSEVHVFSEGVSSEEEKNQGIGKLLFYHLLIELSFLPVNIGFITVTSLFKFSLPSQFPIPPKFKDIEESSRQTDEDGDLIVRRRNQSGQDYNLTISTKNLFIIGKVY